MPSLLYIHEFSIFQAFFIQINTTLVRPKWDLYFVCSAIFFIVATRRVLLVKQELLTLSEHLHSLLVFVILDLQSYVQCFVDHCLSICNFCFGHCVAVVLRSTASDSPFGIFKLVLNNRTSNIEYFAFFFSRISFIYLRPDPVRIVYTRLEFWISVLGTDRC